MGIVIEINVIGRKLYLLPDTVNDDVYLWTWPLASRHTHTHTQY